MRGKSILNDFEYWRTRAKETRAIAETIPDRLSRHALLQIANDYERTAQVAEERFKTMGTVSGDTSHS